MKISYSFRAKHLRDAKLNSRKFQINTAECRERRATESACGPVHHDAG